MGLRQAILMNITVKIHGSRNFICRPDTTWERESRDFYSPEFASELFYTPVVFARISKAGKCIGRKFAARYYDGLNFGILLYPGEILNAGRPESLGAASILDHTSILPFPLFQPVVFATSGNSFSLEKDGKMIYSTSVGTENFLEMMEDAICVASEAVSQRIGDLMAVELAAPGILCGKDEKRAGISASFCGNSLFRLSIIK